MNDIAQAPDQNDQPIGMPEHNQVPKFRHHVKKHWPRVVSGLALLLLVAIGFTLLTKPETKPGEAIATTYADMFGIGGFAGAGQLKEFPNSLNAAGVKTMRAPFSWTTEQPIGEDDPINNFDEFAALAQSKGIRVLGVLAYTPNWAHTDACHTSTPANKRQLCEPASAQKFATWAGKMARHYKQYGINDWEIWNEPNHGGFWKSERPPAQSINPVKYANMVMKSWEEIKKPANNPSARIYVGATAGAGDYTPEPNASSIDPRAFLRQLYEEAKNQNRNFSDYYTALSHHPYTWSDGRRPIVGSNFDTLVNWKLMHDDYNTNGTEDNTGDDNSVAFSCPTVAPGATLNQRWSALNSVGPNDRPSLRCIMTIFGAASKKIWVTEYGAPTGLFHFKTDNGDQAHVAGDIDRNHTDDVQIAVIREAMEKWKTYPWAGNFYVFRWADNVPFTSSVMAATDPDVQVRQGLLKRTVNVDLADDAPVNAFGCTGGDGLTPTGRAKKTYCWLKQKLDDPLGGAIVTGLRGQYYPNETLTGTPIVRNDSDVNFVWGSAPIAGVPNDGYSVRWTGKIRSTTAGTYRIRTYSDDGVRLWIGGTQKISNWTVHSPTYNTTTVSLNANTQYNIRLEHFDRQFGARIQLEWDTPGGDSSFTTIPSDRFSLP
jgi:hypothetical protein